MKKLALTIAIVLGLGLTTFANGNQGGGMLGRGDSKGGHRDTGFFQPRIPDHGMDTNQNAPLGTGIVVLTTLGAAYLVGKKRKEE